MAVPPAAAIIAAVSSMVSGRPYDDGFPLTLRPVQYTVAPASASARATPRPAPRVAPATSATRPVRGFRCDLFFATVEADLQVGLSLRPKLFADAVDEELHPPASVADVHVEMFPFHKQLAELTEEAPVRAFVKLLASDVIQRLVAPGTGDRIGAIRHSLKLLSEQYDDDRPSFST